MDVQEASGLLKFYIHIARIYKIDWSGPGDNTMDNYRLHDTMLSHFLLKILLPFLGGDDLEQI